ncbi:MAG TPA: hypothetical protein IAB62_10465 [Candidatus Coprocola pullicola]|nr:hypothetical protein [Candidatus Coprocola pullicola]
MLPREVRTPITIYNQFDKENGIWKATQLYGVMWDNTKARNVNTSSITNADALSMVIPQDVQVIGEQKVYKQPKEWKKQPQGAWTIQSGDIVVKGLVDDDILSQRDLEGKYDEVYVINTIDPKFFGPKEMWHWEVGAN